MSGRILKLIFSLAIALGILWGLLQLRREYLIHSDLRGVYVVNAGRFRPFDPGDEQDEIYVRCMVNEPLNLQWKYSLPQGVQFMVVMQHPRGTARSTVRTPTPPGAGEFKPFKCNWTIEIDSSGRCVSRFNSGSGGGSGGYDFNIASFLKEHWDELEVEVTGLDSTDAFKSDRLVTLMKISFPDSLLSEAEKALGAGRAKEFEYPILICIGQADSKEWKTLELNPMFQRTMRRHR